MFVPSAPYRSHLPVREPTYAARVRRAVERGLLAALLAAVVVVLWGCAQAVLAARALHAAERDVTSLRTDVLKGDLAAARPALVRAQDRTRAAERHTAGWAFGAAAHVPVLGRHLRAVDDATTAGAALSGKVLAPLVDALDVAQTRDLLHDGQVDLDALRTVRDRVAEAAGSTRLVSLELRHDRGPLVGPVRRRVQALRDEVSRLDDALQTADQALAIAPDLLGAQGSRRYLVVVQNNAEARATGGLIGSYAVLTTDHGRVALGKAGSDRDLRSSPTPVTTSPGGAAIWPRIGSRTAWFYANLSPHFPEVGETLKGLWRQRTGQTVDGVLALDPVVLSHLLEPVGRVRHDGVTVTAKTVVPFVLHDEYVSLRDNNARKDLLGELADEIFAKVLSPARPLPALRSMVAAARSGHLLVWSSHAEEQEVLAGGVVGGALPQDDEPFVTVLTQNLAGNKLDWYLRRTVTLTRLPDGQVRVDVTLHSDVPPGQPAYVLGNDHKVLGVAAGRASTLLSVYGAISSRITAFSGGRLVTERDTDHGHQLVSVVVPLPQDRDVTVSVTFTMPPGHVRYAQQPLGRPDTVVRR